MSEPMNTTKAAKAVGIAPTTLREWIKTHSIEVRKIKGNYAFFPDDIEMLKRVKTAKDMGEDVEHILNPEQPKHPETLRAPPVPSSDGLKQFQDAIITSLSPLSELGHTFKDIHHQSLQAMKTITELEIELETTRNELKQAHGSIDMFQPDLERLKETISSLKNQNQILENDIKRTRDELEQKTEKSAQLSEDNQALRSELDKLKESLETEQKKSWWDKLRGR